MKVKLFVLCLAVVTCAVILVRCSAGEDQPRSAANNGVVVELFAAVKSGQLQIVIIAQNFSLMTVRARNTTGDVLKVLLPKSFAALPTAQLAETADAPAARTCPQPKRRICHRSDGIARACGVPAGTVGVWYADW